MWFVLKIKTRLTKASSFQINPGMVKSLSIVEVGIWKTHSQIESENAT